MNPGFVVLMGISTVFIGLIILILLCTLMGAVCRKFIKEEKAQPAVAVAAPAAPAVEAIANRQEFIAAVSAVIAEEMGTEVEAIRVLSVKKV